MASLERYHTFTFWICGVLAAFEKHGMTPCSNSVYLFKCWSVDPVMMDQVFLKLFDTSLGNPEYCQMPSISL